MAELNWSQRLKQYFGIDIQTCEHCGREVKCNANIDDPLVIEMMIAHKERFGAAGARTRPC